MALHRWDRGTSDREPGCRCGPTSLNYVEEGEQLHPTEVGAPIALVGVPYTLVWSAMILRLLRDSAARDGVVMWRLQSAKADTESG
jgi:hypothetical protein